MLSQKNGNKTYEFKSAINLIELYRRERLYEKAFSLIKNYNSYEPDNDTLTCRYLHRSAAVYNEYHAMVKIDSYLDLAEVISKKALSLATKINHQDYIATSLNELGNIYEKQGMLDKAKITYEKSIKIWKPISQYNYYNALKNKGSYFLRIEEYDSAIQIFNKIINFDESIFDNQILADSHWGLIQCYKAKGDSVLYYKNLYKEIYYVNLITESKLENRLIELSERYDSQLKDQLIQETKIQIDKEKEQSNRILIITVLLLVLLGILTSFFIYSRVKNQQLKKLLKENNFLIGESNHRIKNNLQLIISLIGREVYKSKQKNQQLSEISEKINSIASLHQQLYLKDSKDKIAIKEYIESIIDNFKQLNYFANIELSTSLENVNVKIENSVYLGLLITELFTNTVKYAFQDQNEKPNTISLEVKAESEFLILGYADNGIGIKKSDQPSLINLILKQLDAQIKDSEKEGGYNLKFKIRI